MFPDEMLNKVILSITRMCAILYVTSPPFQLTVPLILMSHPVGLALERFWLRALCKGTGEGLYILMYVLGPV